MAKTRDQFTVLVENWALQQTGSNIHNPKEGVWNIDIRLCAPDCVTYICPFITLQAKFTYFGWTVSQQQRSQKKKLWNIEVP